MGEGKRGNCEIIQNPLNHSLHIALIHFSFHLCNFPSTELKPNRFHPSKQSFYFIGSFTSLFVLVREGLRRETARECAVPRRKHHGERWIGRGKGRAKQQDHPERAQQSLSPYQRYAYSR